MTEISLDDYYDATVVDTDGEKVGGVGQVFLDEETGQPSWVTVRTGLFGLKESFIPLVDAHLEDGRLHVAFTAGFIKGAPHLDPEAPMTVAEEDALQAYYGTEDEPEKMVGQQQHAAPAADDQDALADSPVDEDYAPISEASGATAVAPPKGDPLYDRPVEEDYEEHRDDVLTDPPLTHERVRDEGMPSVPDSDGVGEADDTERLPEGISRDEHVEWTEPEKHVYQHQTDFASEADEELVEEGARLHRDEPRAPEA